MAIFIYSKETSEVYYNSICHKFQKTFANVSIKLIRYLLPWLFHVADEGDECKNGKHRAKLKRAK